MTKTILPSREDRTSRIATEWVIAYIATLKMVTLIFFCEDTPRVQFIGAVRREERKHRNEVAHLYEAIKYKSSYLRCLFYNLAFNESPERFLSLFCNLRHLP